MLGGRGGQSEGRWSRADGIFVTSRGIPANSLLCSALRRGTTHLLDSTFFSLLVRGWINAVEGSGPAFARTLPHATSARRGFLRPSARRGGLGLEVPGTATVRC